MTILLWVSGLHADVAKFQTSIYIGYGVFLLQIIIVVLGIKATRDIDGEGYMTYGRGIGVGAIIGTISSIISSLFYFIYVKALNPMYNDVYKEYSQLKVIEYYKKMNMSEEQINQALQQSNSLISQDMSFLIQLITGIIVNVLFAIIVALIASAILKRIKPEEFKEV